MEAESRRDLHVFGLAGERFRPSLRRVLPGVAFLDSLGAVAEALGHSQDAIVVFDPLAPGCSADSLSVLRTQFPVASFVVYTALDPRHFQIVAGLVRAGFADIVLAGYDDTRERFDRLFADLASRVTPRAFVGAIQSSLDLLPKRLCLSVELMLRDPVRYRCTLDLALAARLSRRALFRHLALAGFGSPRRLVASARVLRAHLLLQDDQRSVLDVARRLGYRSPDQMKHHFVQLAACTPGQARRTLAAKEFSLLVAATVEQASNNLALAGSA